MLTGPLPDLAAALRLQELSGSLRGALDAAGQELTTGIAADIPRHVRGDLAPVFAIDAALERLAMERRDLGLAGARAAAAQGALGLVEGRARDYGLGLLGAIDRGDAVSGAAYRAEAAAALETVLGALNTRFGTRALFAGAAEDGTALAGLDTLLAAVGAAVSGTADPAAARAALDAFFDSPGGGFETLIYGGASIDAAGVALPGGQREAYLPRADDPALRATLKALVMVATAEETGFAGDPGALRDYLSEAAGALVGAADRVTGLRAALGTSERRIVEAAEAVAAETAAMGLARAEAIGVDQYDAAARFADLEGQLEALYLVTARISNLTLTNFLR